MFPKIDENFSNIKTVQLKIYIYIYISALFFILLINLKIKEIGNVLIYTWYFECLTKYHPITCSQFEV